jgi:transporter family protein
MNIDLRLALLSGLTILMWGLWGFFGKMALGRKMPPAAIFLLEVLISAACAVPVLLVLIYREDARPLHASWNVFGILSGAGLALGLLCYYFTLEKGQASIVVPLTATYPVVSVLLSYAVLHERPSLSQWVGIILVIVGAVLLLTGPLENTPQE